MVPQARVEITGGTLKISTSDLHTFKGSNRHGINRESIKENYYINTADTRHRKIYGSGRPANCSNFQAKRHTGNNETPKQENN
jgi:hypothetical protein